MSAAKVFMTGRVSNDPKTFSNEDGSKKRMLFNLACNVKAKDYERADFIPCIMWGDDRIEKISPWLLKGRLVEITGELRTYDKRDENDKFLEKKVEVQVNTLEFLDRKPEGVEAPPAAAVNNDTEKSAILQLLQQTVAALAGENGAALAGKSAEATSDDIPF